MGDYPTGRYFGFIVDLCQATQVPSLGELTVYDPSNAPIPLLSAGANNTNGGYPPSNMIDGNINSFWLAGLANQVPRAIVWVDLGSSQTVRGFKLQTRNDYYGMNESWKNFRAFAVDYLPSDDYDGLTGHVVGEYTDQIWSEGQNRTYEFYNGPSAIISNQLALTVITAEGAEGIEVDSLVITAVQLEIDYIPMLVPISLPGYTFSGKGYYIQRR